MGLLRDCRLFVLVSQESVGLELNDMENLN